MSFDGGFVNGNARILLVNHKLPQILERACAEMATMLGRGFITSRTVVSPNSDHGLDQLAVLLLDETLLGAG